MLVDNMKGEAPFVDEFGDLFGVRDGERANRLAEARAVARDMTRLAALEAKPERASANAINVHRVGVVGRGDRGRSNRGGRWRVESLVDEVDAAPRCNCESESAIALKASAISVSSVLICGARAATGAGARGWMRTFSYM